MTGVRLSVSAPTTRSVERKMQTVEAKEMPRKARTAKRHYRIRNKVSGTDERPRLAVFRSNNHIYAQVIDDLAGNTLAAMSTLNEQCKSEQSGNVEAAEKVGKELAALCLERGIEKVVFDRGGNLYHGRVKALAEGAREGGLVF